MRMTSFDDPRRIQATYDEVDGLCIVISAPTAPALGGLILSGLIACAGIGICVVFLATQVIRSTWHFDPNAFIPPPVIAAVIVLTLLVLPGTAHICFVELRRREVIQVDGQHIKLATFPRMIPRRRVSAYALGEVSNLRYAPSLPPGSRANPDFIKSLAFDYEGSTVHFVRGVPEKLSRQILKTVKDRYKIAEDKDESLPVERL